jgi:hypothetical protein
MVITSVPDLAVADCMVIWQMCIRRILQHKPEKRTDFLKSLSEKTPKKLFTKTVNEMLQN